MGRGEAGLHFLVTAREALVHRRDHLTGRELGEKHPIVDLNLFRNRNFLVGSAAFCLGWLCVAMMAFV